MARMRITRQRDAMQCGAACICMVCNYFGMKSTLEWIESYCKPMKDGISMKGLTDSARNLGFDAVAARVPTERLGSLPLPAVLHWNQNHFVVLYKVSRKGERYHIADPAKGKIKYSREEFGRHWESTTVDGEPAGIAMFFDPIDTVEEPLPSRPKKRSFGFLLGYLRQYGRYFFQIGLGLLLGCLLQLVMPFLTQSIVDTGIKHSDMGFIWLVLLGELMIVTGRMSADFIRRWLLMHISMRINISLVSDFFIKLMNLPMSFFDTKLMGDLLQRIGDHSRVQNFLTNQVLGIVFTMLTFVIFGIVLYVYSSVIFLTFLVGSIVYGLWIVRFLGKRKLLDYELFELQAENQNRTYQFVTSMQEIKLQNCERRRRWEWEDTQATLFGVQMKAMKLQQAQEAGSIFINEVKNIVITVLAASAVINGQLTLGAMLAVQYIIGQLNSPVSQLMSFIYSVQDVKLSLERINEIHDGEKDETSEELAHSYAGEKSISFRNVDFKYNIYAYYKNLDGVSFDIPAGKVTAIVGASGSGKTTLIKLMLGYYPATSGCISVGGRDISEYNLRWWRRQCGVVMQDGVIFSESIARNIAVDDGPIDEERLLNAARIANIHDFAMELPLKYNTRIGADGRALSQGQKQRVLIARAVYRNPDFIFLDEATNALDAKNERSIVENLAEFYKGRTVVIVAHRLSTVKNADQILVVDGGKIAESGNHASLVEKKGVYYNLVRNQLELGE